MSHVYAKRTYDEAQELARLAFKAAASTHLPRDVLDELFVHGLLASTSPGADWEDVIGVAPTERDFYEIELYKPADSAPHIVKSYVRILVPRDRASEQVHFMWQPSIERS